MLRLGVITILMILLPACGRYEPPLPPESFAPQVVKELQVLGQLDGVHFNWRTPLNDTRGEQLSELDGYQLYRKEITKMADILDRDVEFKLIATLSDTAVSDRELRRKAALDAGLPTRKVKVDDNLTAQQYVDTAVVPGSTYVYKLVAFNQGDVEGKPAPLIRVLFRGMSSVIDTVTGDTFEEAVLDEEAF